MMELRRNQVTAGSSRALSEAEGPVVSCAARPDGREQVQVRDQTGSRGDHGTIWAEVRDGSGHALGPVVVGIGGAGRALSVERQSQQQVAAEEASAARVTATTAIEWNGQSTANAGWR